MLLAYDSKINIQIIEPSQPTPQIFLASGYYLPQNNRQAEQKMEHL